MTGADFLRIFEGKVDQAYSNYLSPTQENDLFKEALFATILDVYNKLSDQESYDDIASVIKTAEVFNLNNNKIFTSPIPFLTLTVGVPTTIETKVPHNLITGNKVYITGVQGTASGVNDAFHDVTVISTTTFTIPIDTTATTYTASTGEVSKATDSNDVNILVNNYWALLALKAKYNQTLQLSVTDATNASPIRIKLNKRNNVKTGELINISGVNGNLNANGDRYVKKINTFQYDLYNDKDLTVPINGNGTFAGVGTIKRIYYKSATPYYSSRQISKYSEPSISSPMFDRADNLIKVLPNDSICQELTMDYISTPPVDIDVNNSTLDLENYFHYDFLIEVADKAKMMFFERSKDFESVQAELLVEQPKV